MATSPDVLDEAILSAEGTGIALTQTPLGSSVPDVTIIEAKTGWRALDLPELWRYRELVYFLIWRDIKVRYKQTVLGAMWAILQPVMTMLVFTVFFGRLGGMSKLTTQAYPVFVYAALLPWQLFSTSVTASSNSLVGSANMISKVYFPRLAVPIASVGPAVVDFLISGGVMAILMVCYGVVPGVSILLLPVLILGTLVATLGVGTILSALTVSYRDFRYVVPFMIQLWMFASPVAYGIERVPSEWRWAYAINPMAGIIGAFRSCLLNEPVLWDTLAISLGVSFILLIAGVTYFRNVERRFADIV